MAGSCVIENVAKDLQAVVGASWCGSAVIVEPTMHLGSGDLIEAQGTECRQQTGLKTLVSPQGPWKACIGKRRSLAMRRKRSL